MKLDGGIRDNAHVDCESEKDNRPDKATSDSIMIITCISLSQLHS